MSRFFRIKPTNVEANGPYIECGNCERTITGHTPEEVVKKANEEKFMYDYDNDFVYCGYCYSERKNMIINLIKGGDKK